MNCPPYSVGGLFVKLGTLGPFAGGFGLLVGFFLLEYPVDIGVENPRKVFRPKQLIFFMNKAYVT